MIALALIGAAALVLATPLLAGLLAIYNAYWAVKIWALLVVPVFHWAPLPLAGAVGLALAFHALRPYDKTSTNEEKEESAIQRTVIALIVTFGAAPLTYAVAWCAAKILL